MMMRQRTFGRQVCRVQHFGKSQGAVTNATLASSKMNSETSVIISNMTMTAHARSEVHIFHIGIERQSLIERLCNSHIKPKANIAAVDVSESCLLDVIVSGVCGAIGQFEGSPDRHPAINDQVPHNQR